MTQPVRIKTRNAATTRSGILVAARNRFLREGYDQVGLRAIAADAGADPALICRYFGGKERLFAEVLETTSKDPMEILAGDRATFGLRVARALLDSSERTPERMAFIQLAARSSASPVAATLVRNHIEQQFIKPFTAWLGGERAAEKAWLVGSILMGVAIMAGIACAQPSSERNDAAIERLARLLQQAIDQP